MKKNKTTALAKRPAPAKVPSAKAWRAAKEKRARLLEQPIGATGKGWHSIAHLPACPQAYLYNNVRSVRPVRQTAPDYLSIGILFHVGRAQWLYDGYAPSSPWREAMQRHAERYVQVEGEKLHPDGLRVATKCMEAYVDFWSMRPRPEVLAVEHHVGPRVLAPHTYYDMANAIAREARLDAVVRWPSGPNAGTWISEAKTSGTYIGDVATHYGLHGQVLTQVALWGPDEVKRFGPLKGVALDVVMKPSSSQKARPQEPKFLPLEEMPYALKWSPASITSWAAQAALVKWGDKVERRVGNCGRCPFRSLCLKGKEMSYAFTYRDPGDGARKNMMKWTPSAEAPTPPWE